MINYKVGDLISVSSKYHGFIKGIVLKTYPSKDDLGLPERAYIKVLNNHVGTFYNKNFKGKNWSRVGVKDHSGYYVSSDDIVINKISCTSATYTVRDNFHTEEVSSINPDGTCCTFTRNKKICGSVTRVMTNSFWNNEGVFSYAVVDRQGFLGISDVSSEVDFKDLIRQAYIRAEVNCLSREV